MNRIWFLTLLLIYFSPLIAMDEPEQPLFLDCLGTDIRADLLPKYVASARQSVTDNRGDVIAEQVRSAKAYKVLLKQRYSTDITKRDAAFIDIMLQQTRANPPPPKNSSCLPNRVCLTAFFNPELLRSEFGNPEIRASRIAEFRELPHKEKNESIVQVMRLCPSLVVTKGLLDAGASPNACARASGYSLLRLAVEAQRLPVSEKKQLVTMLTQTATLNPDVADKHEITPLMRAASLGDVDATEAIVMAHANVNAMDRSYNTVLGIAAHTGNQAIVEQLLAKHPNIYLCNPYHFSNNVLAQAVKGPDESKIVPTLQKLVRARHSHGDINKVRELEYFADVALIEAARLGRTDAINFLMHMPGISFDTFEKSPPFFNPDVSVAGTHDHSALTASLDHGFFDITLLLLENAPDVPKYSLSLAKDNREKALRLAVHLRAHLDEKNEPQRCNKLDRIIDHILETELVPLADSICLPACLEAASMNHQGLLKKLIDHAKAKDPLLVETALFTASVQGNATAISALLEYWMAHEETRDKKVLVNATDMNRETALHKAIIAAGVDDMKTAQITMKNNAPVVADTRHSDVKAIEVLLKNDANIFQTNKWGQSVFHKVVINSDATIRTVLLKMFADAISSGELVTALINAASFDTGDTPLLVACALPGRLETAKQLIALGAQVNQANKRGETPLFKATAHFQVDVVRILLEAGADPNAKNLSGCGPLTKAAGANPYKEHEITNAQEIIRLLEQYGATFDDFKDSMLRNAARNGNTQLAQNLLKSGANILSGSSSFGNTALHQAAKNGHVDTVEFLLEHMDPYVPNAAGFTAMELAVAHDATTEMIETFLFHKNTKP